MSIHPNRPRSEGHRCACTIALIVWSIFGCRGALPPPEGCVVLPGATRQEQVREYDGGVRYRVVSLTGDGEAEIKDIRRALSNAGWQPEATDLLGHPYAMTARWRDNLEAEAGGIWAETWRNSRGDLVWYRFTTSGPTAREMTVEATLFRGARAADMRRQLSQLKQRQQQP